MTPDISADTWLGARGCASGSHAWNGARPAFDVKANSTSAIASVEAPGDSMPALEASVSNVAKSDPPPRMPHPTMSAPAPNCAIAR